jgi:hypothetical protein
MRTVSNIPEYFNWVKTIARSNPPGIFVGFGFTQRTKLIYYKLSEREIGKEWRKEESLKAITLI